MTYLSGAVFKPGKKLFGEMVSLPRRLPRDKPSLRFYADERPRTFPPGVAT